MTMPAMPRDRSNHRTDIDGLRAVAVSAVVLYHLEKSFIPGGYLGVDIFFVLSGYLIAGIIWRDMRGGDFSILQFYERRIRRIMPALALLLLVTTIAATIILLPSDLSNYAKSVLATIFIVPNLYFWRDTNYFSPNAEEKPLLHLWSLGVEEQFYFVFPLVLWLVAGYRLRVAIIIVALTIALSLASHIFLTSIGGASPAFYWLPSRAWELGVGALLAIAGGMPRNAQTATITGILGAGLIGLGLLGYPATLGRFPIALPVVLGTAMVIWSGSGRVTALGRVLSAKPLVLLGLISYSLYLWHWPIIVLSQYYLIRSLTLLESTMAVAVMLLAAVLSWRYVEQPFRQNRLAFRHVAIGALASTAVLISASLMLILSAGLPQRLNDKASTINAAVGTNYRCRLQDFMPYGLSRSCALNLDGRDPYSAQVVVLGNSHAQMYAPAWRSVLTDQGMTGILVPQNGCLPTVAANINVDCVNSARNILTEISSHTAAQIVVIALTWQHGSTDLVDPNGTTVDNTQNRALNDALDDTVRRLADMGKSVVLVGPIAIPGVDIASITGRELAFGRVPSLPADIPVDLFMNQYQISLQHFSGRTDVTFVRPDAIQCDASNCYFIRDGEALFADSNHIAAAQSLRFKGLFTDGLARAISLREGVK